MSGVARVSVDGGVAWLEEVAVALAMVRAWKEAERVDAHNAF